MSKNIDAEKNRDVLIKLRGLGLKEKEAKVYMALLPRRDTGAYKLVQVTGLHGQFVYDALEKLEKLGLAKHAMEYGHKKFSANSPMRLLSLAEEKRVMAQTLSRSLQHFYSGAHEQDFEVFQGEGTFIAHEFETLKNVPQNTCVDVIGGGKDQYWTIITREGYATDFERVRKEKNVIVRYLSSDETLENTTKMKGREGWTHRILPGLSTGLIGTDIWPNAVHFNIFGNPVISFVISGKEIASGYKEFFETLWKIAK